MTSYSRAKVRRNLALSPFLLLPVLLGAGCSRPQPVTMAPPVNNAPINTAPPVTSASQQSVAPTGENVYDWHDVPTDQQIPVTRGVFDQSGYQLFAQSGETIVVPFVNQNMYVMRFGKSTNGGMYFTSDGKIPTLYVPNGGYLENAVAQGARWFPFPKDYAYSQPVYLGIAPSWSAYTGMGWYPGMAYYGGYWSPHPYGYGGGISPFVAMVGLNFLIGGRPYYGWNSYQNYYRSNPGSSVRMRTVYNNYNNTRRNSPSAFGRSRYGSSGNSGSMGRRMGGGGTGSTGSFGTRRPFGSGSASTGTGSTGSFGSSRRNGTGSSTFGGSSRPSGSFGSGSSSGYSGSTRRGTGSFGGGSSSGYGGSFGSSRRTFGSGSSGSSSSAPSFGSSRRSSGGSFSGGGSFGGGRRSSGGFGRRR